MRQRVFNWIAEYVISSRPPIDQSLRIAFLTNGHNNRVRELFEFFFWCALVWFVLLALIYSRCLIWFCYKIRKVALDLQPLVFQLSRLKDLNGFDMTIKNHLITEPNYFHFRRLIIPTNEIQCWGTDMEFPPQKNSLMVSRTDHKTSWENFIAILKF